MKWGRTLDRPKHFAVAGAPEKGPLGDQNKAGGSAKSASRVEGDLGVFAWSNEKCLNELGRTWQSDQRPVTPRFGCKLKSSMPFSKDFGTKQPIPLDVPLDSDLARGRDVGQTDADGCTPCPKPG